MNTEEIIEYLEVELADASVQFELAMGKDAQAALISHIKASTIHKILEDIAIREKRYSELSMSERQKTFKNWQARCLEANIFDYCTFGEYDEEQLLLDLNFDARTLECLG